MSPRFSQSPQASLVTRLCVAAALALVGPLVLGCGAAEVSKDWTQPTESNATRVEREAADKKADESDGVDLDDGEAGDAPIDDADGGDAETGGESAADEGGESDTDAVDKTGDGASDSGDGGSSDPDSFEFNEHEPVQSAPDSIDAESTSIIRTGDDNNGWSVRRARQRSDDAVAEIERLSEKLSRATGASCSDTCELADAICESQRVICEISDQYGRTSQCEWATRECDSAQEACTRCGGRDAR